MFEYAHGRRVKDVPSTSSLPGDLQISYMMSLDLRTQRMALRNLKAGGGQILSTRQADRKNPFDLHKKWQKRKSI
jgi:hypothetical protein